MGTNTQGTQMANPCGEDTVGLQSFSLSVCVCVCVFTFAAEPSVKMC